MINIDVNWIQLISTSEGEKYTFAGALAHRYKHISSNWKKAETRKQYEKIYNNIILPALKDHNEKPLDEYTKDDFVEAIERINNKGYEQSGIHHSYAESTIHQFQNLIYYVVFHASVFGLCENVLWGTTFDIDISSSKEQEEIESRVHLKKSLSVEQEKRLSKELFFDPHEEGAKIALLLMWGLGLRNAEACGLNYSDIKPIEGHSNCFVAWIYKTTIIDSNELQSSGKTYNSGRVVPVPERIIQFLAERKEIIKSIIESQSRTDVSVDELPICNNGWLQNDSDSFLHRCKADDVTLLAHTVFQDANISSKQVAYLDAELSEGNTAALLKEKDPTAYLLRRNYATQMCILGLTYAEMQYLMGHNVEDAYESRNDFVDSERQYSMYLKLQRRSILNDLVDSNNTFTTTINGKAQVKISATAAEPSDKINIQISSNSKEELRTMWFESSSKREFDRTVNILEQYNSEYQ